MEFADCIRRGALIIELHRLRAEPRGYGRTRRPFGPITDNLLDIFDFAVNNPYTWQGSNLRRLSTPVLNYRLL